jgi:hypothetical protein
MPRLPLMSFSFLACAAVRGGPRFAIRFSYTLLIQDAIELFYHLSPNLAPYPVSTGLGEEELSQQRALNRGRRQWQLHTKDGALTGRALHFY